MALTIWRDTGTPPWEWWDRPGGLKWAKWFMEYRNHWTPGKGWDVVFFGTPDGDSGDFE